MKLAPFSREICAAGAALLLLTASARAAYLPGLANNGAGYGGEPYSSMIAQGPGLTSSWTMGDKSGSTAAGDSVSGNTLTNHGTVTFGNAGLVPFDRFSSANVAASSCLAAASSSVLSFDMSQPFWMWLVVNNAAGGSEYAYLTKAVNSGSFNGLFYEIAPTNVSGFYMIGSSTLTHGGPVISASTAHQVGFEWDGTNLASLVVDGTVQNISVTAPSGSMLNSGIFSLAARDCGQSDVGEYNPGSFAHVALGLGTGMVTPPSGYSSYAQNFYTTGQYMTFLGRQLPPLFRGVPNVILDSDGHDDIDNYGDLRMFGTLSLAGKINPIAYIASDDDPHNVAAAHIGLNYLGVTVPEYACNQATGAPGGYTQDIVGQFNPGDSCSNYDSDVVGYCKALHNAPDQSVTVVIGGGAISFDNFVNTAAPACGADARSGVALACAKLTQVVWVAGGPPTLSAGDYNLSKNASNSQDLIDNWATNCPRVPFTFWGIDQTDNQSPQPSTGPFGSSACVNSTTDPFQRAFYDYLTGSTNPCLREAWSQSALYYVANGLGSNFGSAGVLGSASFNASTGGSWTTGAGPFNYLYAKLGGAAMQTLVCGAEHFGSTNWC